MSDDEESRTIWCGNLSEKVSHDILFELFYQAGPLDKVRIPKDREGRQRNFGFVTYSHQESVPYAVDLFHGTLLFDRCLVMRMQKSSEIKNSSPDIPNLIGRHPPIEFPQFEPDMDKKFMAMTNQMIINGMPLMSNQFEGPPVCYSSSNSQNLNAASIQGQWPSRNKPHEQDRESRRYEPYKDRGGDWGRRGDRERGRDHSRNDWGHKDRNGGNSRDYHDRHRNYQHRSHRN